MMRSASVACAVLLACLAAVAGAQRGSPPPQPDATPSLTPAVPAAQAPAPGAPLSSTAEAVYAQARPRLLQIRTLVQSAGGQATIGSGFVVSPRGFALTNYHVVSQYALEPSTYRLEYVAPDGTSGPLKLHAIDIANDLAVVQLERQGLPHFSFDERAVKGELPEGRAASSRWAIRSTSDSPIVEGHLQRPRRQELQRAHPFLGRAQSGHERRPDVTAGGRVAGVNVAKQVGSDLVSFLVPRVTPRRCSSAPKRAAR
jgi:hypothetical protein